MTVDARRVRLSLTVAGAMASTTLAITPPSLVGAMAVLMTRDLAFDESALGGATAVFFAATAMTSVPGGRMAEHLGARRAMQLAAVTTGLCLLAASLVRHWWHLLVLLAVAGVANGLAQPGSNLALATHVPAERQGIAFGVKQSAVPLAGLAAGLSVPLVGVTLGWRAAFLTAAGGALVVLTMVAGRPDHRPARRRQRSPRRPPALLLGLAGACCLGTSAGLSLTTFLVPYAVQQGHPAAAAGWLLAAGGLASTTARLVAGWVADHHPRHCLTITASMLLLGSLAYASFALGTPNTWWFGALAMIGFALGWGWQGLFALSVVRQHPGAPAVATGVTQAGGALGGVLGPTVFGVLVVQGGYPAGWCYAAAAAAAGSAALFTLGRRATPE